MADISDVENALVNAISSALFVSPYTNYMVQTTELLTTNIPVRLFRGWPVDSTLVTDLKAGVTSISVFSDPSTARNATKYLRNTTLCNTAQISPTMTAVLSGSNVTFAGTTNVGQTIGIGVRNFGPGYGFSYRLQTNDTPTSVAALFATNLPGATSNGAVLTINAPNRWIKLQVGGDVTQWMEVHRNQQVFMVTVWSPTVAIRDQLCGYLDPQLIYINHLSFPDGSVSEPVIGAGTHIDDVVQKEFMWRRTLYYTITYPTSYTQQLPVMTLGQETINGTTLID